MPAKPNHLTVERQRQYLEGSLADLEAQRFALEHDLEGIKSIEKNDSNSQAIDQEITNLAYAVERIVKQISVRENTLKTLK